MRSGQEFERRLRDVLLSNSSTERPTQQGAGLFEAEVDPSTTCFPVTVAIVESTMKPQPGGDKVEGDGQEFERRLGDVLLSNSSTERPTQQGAGSVGTQAGENHQNVPGTHEHTLT